MRYVIGASFAVSVLVSALTAIVMDGLSVPESLPVVSHHDPDNGRIALCAAYHHWQLVANDTVKGMDDYCGGK